MKHSYTLQELSIIIDYRVTSKLTWDQISELLNVSVRDLKLLSPLINQHRPCLYCKRPVPLFHSANKEFCSNVCYSAYYRGYVRTIEAHDGSFMGHRYSLNREQILQAMVRRYDKHEPLEPIANDLGVAVSTLSRTLLQAGGKSLKNRIKHDCPVCLKPFFAKPNAKYCSGRCRTVACRSGIAKVRNNPAQHN